MPVLIIAGAALGLPFALLAAVFMLGYAARTVENFIAGREARREEVGQAEAIIPPDAFTAPPVPPPATPARPAAAAKPAATAAAPAPAKAPAAAQAKPQRAPAQAAGSAQPAATKPAPASPSEPAKPAS